VRPDEPAWRRAPDWLADHWLQIIAAAAVVATVSVALWRRLRRG
jgi:hypothetical protein